MPEVPINFIGTPGQRGTGTGDRRNVNVLFEKMGEELHPFTRPGLSNHTQPGGGPADGRGIYAWNAVGRIYSVSGNILYSGTTSTLALNTSTGRVWWVETPETDANHVLIASDGDANYNITTSDVVSRISTVNYPTSNLGPIVYLDGYLFQATSTLRNSNLNSVTSWAAANSLPVNAHGDSLRAIHLQKDQVMSFGSNSVEFQFNNGNPVGSPLLRIDQNILDFGIAHRNSLAWSGELCCFVGENAARGDGSRAVWRIASLQGVKDISDPVINRFLAQEGASISSCSAWMERIGGHLVYVLNLRFANRTFVYDFDSNTWPEFEAAGGGRFNGVSATSLNGAVYIQDESNGRIYTMNASTFRDSGSDFTVRLQSDIYDFGTNRRKVQPRLDVIGDNVSGNLNVSVSDDDYTTSTAVRTIDMSQNRKTLGRLGAFYRRAFILTFASNARLRLRKMIATIEKGRD